eukprot:m.139723 g.139723  ORF g.139723 m.139723 type:complete len:91 (+) comp52554_c0_seq71:389-661(+)
MSVVLVQLCSLAVFFAAFVLRFCVLVPRFVWYEISMPFFDTVQVGLFTTCATKSGACVYNLKTASGAEAVRFQRTFDQLEEADLILLLSS